MVLPHHAAGSWPIQLVGFIVEHLTSMSCGPQHIDMGFFVSQCLSLQHRRRQREQLAAPIGMAKRVAGIALAPPLLRVSVRECEQSF